MFLLFKVCVLSLYCVSRPDGKPSWLDWLNKTLCGLVLPGEVPWVCAAFESCWKSVCNKRQQTLTYRVPHSAGTTYGDWLDEWGQRPRRLQWKTVEPTSRSFNNNLALLKSDESVRFCVGKTVSIFVVWIVMPHIFFRCVRPFCFHQLRKNKSTTRCFYESLERNVTLSCSQLVKLQNVTPLIRPVFKTCRGPTSS